MADVTTETPLPPSKNPARSSISAAGVSELVNKAAASLPSSAPPQAMSHAGTAPVGKVRLTNYVSYD